MKRMINDTDFFSSKQKINLMVEVTNRCQLRCVTCFSHRDGRVKEDMSYEEFCRIIDENYQLINNISFYNYGEPLLNYCISSMISYARKKLDGNLKIATNGINLNHNLQNNLLVSGLDILSISLDGATKETYNQFRLGGNYNQILENIRQTVLLRDKIKSSTKLELQFIIMSHNEHEVAKIILLAKNLGVDRIRLKTILIVRDEWKYLIPKTKKYQRKYLLSGVCTKPQHEIVICSGGSVIPCCYVTGDNLSKYVLGNIRLNSLDEILSSEGYKEFCQNCLQNKNLNECCINCNENNSLMDYKVIDLKNLPIGDI